jgi:hypothetical protein
VLQVIALQLFSAAQKYSTNVGYKYWQLHKCRIFHKCRIYSKSRSPLGIYSKSRSLGIYSKSRSMIYSKSRSPLGIYSKSRSMIYSKSRSLGIYSKSRSIIYMEYTSDLYNSLGPSPMVKGARHCLVPGCLKFMGKGRKLCKLHKVGDVM